MKCFVFNLSEAASNARRIANELDGCMFPNEQSPVPGILIKGRPSNICASLSTHIFW